VGDGVTDDTAAIQRAFDSVNNGGSLYFPAGTYYINSSDPLSYSYDASSITGVFVRDINEVTVYGKGTLQAGTDITPLQFVDCNNLTIRDIQVKGGGKANGDDTGNANTDCHLIRFGGGTTDTGGGLDDVNTNKCQGVVVDGIRAEESQRYGLSFETCTNIIVRNSTLVNNYWSGINMWTVNRAHINNNEIRNIGPTAIGNSYGVACSRHMNTAYCSRINISNNYIEDTSWEGIDSHSGNNLVINGNIIKNAATDVTQSNAGMMIGGSGLHSVVISNNIVYSDVNNNNESMGILVTGLNSTDRAKHITVSGNTCYGNEKDGLRLYHIDHLTVTGNNLYGNQRTGAYINSIQNAIITNNTFNANGGHSDAIDAGLYLAVSGSPSNIESMQINNNFFTNDGAGFGNQDYGINMVGASSTVDIIIKDNYFDGMSNDVNNHGYDSEIHIYNTKDISPSAWVSFSVSGGTPSIDSDHNISSIGDNGVGDFTCNFAANLDNNDYAAVTDVRAGANYSRIYSQSTSQVRFITSSDPSGPANVIVFGGR
jgi:hypothetical protein